jgi:hypothetical protein
MGSQVKCAKCPYYDDAWKDYADGGDNPKLYTAGDKNCLECYVDSGSWQYYRKCIKKMKVIET